MLRDMGAHIPRATLNRFFMAGAEKLLTMLGEAFRTEIRRGGYFMVDETLQTVGVEDKELGRRYMNRYLWEFYNSDKGLVEYVYEDAAERRRCPGPSLMRIPRHWRWYCPATVTTPTRCSTPGSIRM